MDLSHKLGAFQILNIRFLPAQRAEQGTPRHVPPSLLPLRVMRPLSLLALALPSLGDGLACGPSRRRALPTQQCSVSPGEEPTASVDTLLLSSGGAFWSHCIP